MCLYKDTPQRGTIQYHAISSKEDETDKAMMIIIFDCNAHCHGESQPECIRVSPGKGAYVGIRE